MNEQNQAIVLIVEQAPEPLAQVRALLREHYAVRCADAGVTARQLGQQLPRPALVLLDAAGAIEQACALCAALRAHPDTAGIPVVFLVAARQPDDELRAWHAGAADVIVRPPLPEALLARLAAQLELHRGRALLRHQAGLVEHLVRERTAEQAQMVQAVIWALAALAETRDRKTPQHICRLQHFVAALARQLQAQPRFAAELNEEHIGLLFQAAPLHDIGKVGIPDAILLKPGRLSDAEFEVMKLHTVYGRDAIAAVERQLGRSNTFLRYAREIAYSHQEKFDGSGYPQGLAGTAIPLSARLVTVADVYDALISRRVYKPAFTHETAVELIRQGSGEHFDPDVVDAMLMVEEEFRDIAARYSDEAAPSMGMPAAPA